MPVPAAGASVVVRVLSDQRRFKVAVRGGLSRITAGKLKQHIAGYIGPEAVTMQLVRGWVPIADETILANAGVLPGEELGLADAVGAAAPFPRPEAAAHWRSSRSPPHRTDNQIHRFRSELNRIATSATSGRTHVTPPPHRYESPPLRVPMPAPVEDASPSYIADSLLVSPLRSRRRQESRRSPQQTQTYAPGPPRRRTSLSPPSARCARTMAELNLAEFASALGQPLHFGDSLTCVVEIDEKYTVLVTYDQATERLYIYSSLLTSIPQDPAVRLKLYEWLLEGALLGRDMAGGGVGLSARNDFILLSSSIDLTSCTTSALRNAMPPYLESLRRWRRRIRELLARTNPDALSPVHRQRRVRTRDVGTSPPAFARVQERRDFDQDAAVIGLEVTDSVTIDGVRQQTNGLVVVRAKGAAAAAGLLENDTIRGVDGYLVTTVAEFGAAVRRLIPERPCMFEVERDEKMMRIQVVPARGQRPQEVRRYTVQEDNLRGALPAVLPEPEYEDVPWEEEEGTDTGTGSFRR
eukprot:TRINITY_DN19356_c0_g1_i1.p1 TRINITY_DN19356_c0_g1~~TRINITY_DN19356_c0_g1_i1.p1  ORF type:complete len:544 (+),score=123.12 TRINITY_DN19356_c0_g1_i1:62-1633(+)